MFALSTYIRSKNLRNASWIIAEQIFQMGVSLVLGVISARYLGPSNYGALNYTASFVAFFTSMATLGMEGVVVRKLVAHPESEGAILGSAIFLRFISAILSNVLILFIIQVLNPNDTTKLILAALQSIQLIFQAIYILDAWFQRHLKSKYVSFAKMLACIVVSLYKILLLVSAQSLYWFAFSNSLTYIIISIVLVILYKRQSNQKFTFNAKLGKELFLDSYHFAIAGLMVSVYSQIDKIMIGNMLTDTDVGLYVTASGVCSMWIFVPMAIIQSFRPSIIEFKENQNEVMYQLRLKQLFAVITYLSLFVAVAIALIAPYLIKILYGKAYIGAVSILQILIWSEIFAMIGVVRGVWILCEHYNEYIKYYLALGAICNVLLNWWLIPVCGTGGAAIATLITQALVALFAPMLFSRTRSYLKLVFDAVFFNWR